MKVLEAYTTAQQRRTVGGLAALLASGKLRVEDCTDEELERIIAGEQELRLQHLSDDELRAIIRGGA
jgi:hypothetical protein